MHDVAKPLEERMDEDHNIVGADIAEEILKRYNFSADKISKIKKCILYHGGDICLELTNEEWCVRNADIISLFDNFTVFYHIAFVEEKKNYEDGINLVLQMLKSKYNKLDEKLKIKYQKEFELLYNTI